MSKLMQVENVKKKAISHPFWLATSPKDSTMQNEGPGWESGWPGYAALGLEKRKKRRGREKTKENP